MKVDKTKWITKPISSLFDLQMGKTPSRKSPELWGNGNTPWVSISDMNGIKYISSTKEMLPLATIIQCNIPIIPAGIVIMSFKLTIGKTCITNVPLTTNEAIMAFYPKKEVKIDNSFLCYALSAIKWKGNRAVKGLTINKKTISQKGMSLPPLSEQQAIASELDTIQTMIDGYKAQLEDLDALAQSIFLDMFGDPVSNPKGWEKGSLNKYASIGTGATPSRKIVSYYEGDIPWVKSTEVHNSYIWETQEHITKEAIDNSNCSIYLPDTILVAMYGQGKTRGQVGLLRIKAATNQACAAIQCKDSLNPTFCYWHFQMCYEANRELGNGTNQKNMNLTIVGNIKFIIPPLSLQQEFTFKIESIEKQKELICKQLEDAKTMMAERMQYYFS